LDEIFLVEITREWEEDNALVHYLSFTKQAFEQYFCQSQYPSAVPVSILLLHYLCYFNNLSMLIKETVNC